MIKKNAKILIVEDDKFLVKAYALKLEKAGFNVKIAGNGADGLEMAKKEKPSLIILDLMLPKMNGFEFLKKIKSDDGLKNVPVITLSVLGQKADQEKAISLGAEEYFIKTDYTLEEIIGKINDYMSKKR